MNRAKPRRVSVTRSQTYKNWCKAQPCVACMKTGKRKQGTYYADSVSDPAHTIGNGRSSKGADSSYIPLCRPHHDEADGRLSTAITTKAAFAAKYKLDLAAVALEHWNRYQLECGKVKSIRVTIGRVGAHRRVFILDKPPYPYVGDEISVNGEVKPYKVRRIENCDPVLAITFPAGTLKRTDSLAGGGK